MHRLAKVVARVLRAAADLIDPAPTANWDRVAVLCRDVADAHPFRHRSGDSPTTSMANAPGSSM